MTTDDERTAARELAKTDSRLAAAVADPDRFGFAQTLAGAHELLEHYRTAPTLAGLLLDAASDARRLGLTAALTADLLRATTQALWDDHYAPTLAPDGWFPRALDYVTRPLRSDGVRALIPVSCAGQTGYDLADYLQQHLTRTRSTHPVPDCIWQALLHHTHDLSDLTQLGIAADGRDRPAQAELTLRWAVIAGDRWALKLLADLLSRQGRTAEAEQAFRDVAADGDLLALSMLANWMNKQPDRKAEAEQIWRDAGADRDLEVLLRARRPSARRGNRFRWPQ